VQALTIAIGTARAIAGVGDRIGHYRRVFAGNTGHRARPASRHHLSTQPGSAFPVPAAIQRPSLPFSRERHMKFSINPYRSWRNAQQGGIGYVLLWLLGVPLPILIIFGLIRGCA
jgi:hypothetical protein